MNKMLRKIDKILNGITMYRLLLYILIVYAVVSGVLSFLGLLPFSLIALAFSVSALLIMCWISNEIFAKFMRVPANFESAYITALILALIVAPPASGAYLERLVFLFWVSVLAMGSKYILNIGNKHVFNPAALAVAVTALFLTKSANWWIGSTVPLFIFVAIGGLLIARKMRRLTMLSVFIFSALAAIILFGTGNYLSTMDRLFLNSPLVFFGSIMLTEPLTMPPTRGKQVVYGILTGILFAPVTHLGSYYFTPETALLAGNIFSYFASPKGRHTLRLMKKEEVGTGIYNFVFRAHKRLAFRPGQYMEWTLGNFKTDNRGNRRYFTIASSPTENDILLGVRFYPEPSAYKQKMLKMQPGEFITAGALSGDFTLPSDKKKKIVFVAGGIGITPFRSMLKYLADRNEKRDIIVLYSNRLEDEIVYDDVLADAWKKLGVKIIPTLTDAHNVREDWEGLRGRFTPEIIRREIPDYNERTFYISGSERLVRGFEDILKAAGVPRRHIVKDFFSGLA